MLDIISTCMLGRYGFLAETLTTFEDLGMWVDVLLLLKSLLAMAPRSNNTTKAKTIALRTKALQMKRGKKKKCRNQLLKRLMHHLNLPSPNMINSMRYQCFLGSIC